MARTEAALASLLAVRASTARFFGKQEAVASVLRAASKFYYKRFPCLEGCLVIALAQIKCLEYFLLPLCAAREETMKRRTHVRRRRAC